MQAMGGQRSMDAMLLRASAVLVVALAIALLLGR